MISIEKNVYAFFWPHLFKVGLRRTDRPKGLEVAHLTYANLIVTPAHMTRFAVQNVSTAILPGRIAQAKHSTRLSGPQLPHQGIPQVQPRTRGDFCQAGSFLSTAVKEGPAAASPEAAIRAVVLYAMAWVTLQYVARMNRRRLSLTERTVPRQRREVIALVSHAVK